MPLRSRLLSAASLAALLTWVAPVASARCVCMDVNGVPRTVCTLAAEAAGNPDCCAAESTSCPDPANPAPPPTAEPSVVCEDADVEGLGSMRVCELDDDDSDDFADNDDDSDSDSAEESWGD